MIIIIFFLMFISLLTAISYTDDHSRLNSVNRNSAVVGILLLVWFSAYCLTENKINNIEIKEISHVEIDSETFVVYLDDRNNIQTVGSDFIIDVEKYVMVKYYYEAWYYGIRGVDNESIWILEKREVVQEKMNKLNGGTKNNNE